MHADQDIKFNQYCNASYLDAMISIAFWINTKSTFPKLKDNFQVYSKCLFIFFSFFFFSVQQKLFILKTTVIHYQTNLLISISIKKTIIYLLVLVRAFSMHSVNYILHYKQIDKLSFNVILMPIEQTLSPKQPNTIVKVEFFFF